MGTPSTLQLGAWSWLNNNFVAHSASSTGAIIDLNDGTVFALDDSGGSGLGEGLDITTLVPSVYRTQNARSLGQTTVRRIHNTNRPITARIFWSGFSGTYATWLSNLHALIGCLEGVNKDNPGCLKFIPAGGSTPYYFDFTTAYLSKQAYQEVLYSQQVSAIELTFDARPYARAAAVTLSNLAVNPGFEGVFGGGTATTAPTVFSDTFANVNAYAVKAGSAPSVASNVMTIPNGARVAFGSPAWGAMQTWQARFQFLTGQTSDWYFHFTDANNFLDCFAGSTSITLRHLVAGTGHTLATGTISLTNSNFYWIKLTQYPTVSGNPPMVEVQLFNDSAGAVGTAVAGSHLGPVATFDAVTALVGQPQISASGANLPIGGAFSNVHTVSLFGPGAWTFGGVLGSATGAASGAWDGTRSELGMSGNATAGTQTYPNGPVTSFGAGRIDAAPAGTLDAQWNLYGGGAPAGTQAMPIKTAGDVVYAQCQVKSSGLGNGATVKLNYTEYNSSGTSLRTGTLQTLTISGGVQIAWAASGSFSLSGNWTTGANCAYVDVQVRVTDTTAGSANGTVWIDNVQVWDSTTTGQTSMPYCELRFPNSPAQLVVSGIQGNVAAPAFVALGTYFASWTKNTGVTLTLGIGRRALSSANGQLCGPVGYRSTAESGATPTLDTASYGGFYSPWGTAHAPRMPDQHISELKGQYHIVQRVAWSSSNSGDYVNMGYAPYVFVRSQSGMGDQAASSDILFEAIGGAIYNAWNQAGTFQVLDAGAGTVPPTPMGGLGDPTVNYAVPIFYPATAAAIVGTETDKANWTCYLPVDTGAMSALVANPGPFGRTITTQWFWLYTDGLQVPSIAQAATSYSVETTALPSPSGGYAGPGNSSSASIYVNQLASSYLTLDPTLSVGGTTGINQFAAYFADNSATVLALHTEIKYSPLYVWPK